jgi:hypothetical protein
MYEHIRKTVNKQDCKMNASFYWPLQNSEDLCIGQRHAMWNGRTEVVLVPL